MKHSKVLLGGLSVFVLVSLAFSWTAPSVSGQDAYSEDPTKKLLKNALLGAGVGAISASASGGKAGKGALIGAGTNVIGGAVLDMLTGPSQQPQPQPQPVYVQQPQYVSQPQPVEYRPVAQPQSPYSAQTSYNNTPSAPAANSYRNDADEEIDLEEPRKKKASMGGCARKEDKEDLE